MKQMLRVLRPAFGHILLFLTITACKEQHNVPPAAAIDAIKLKRGAVVSCGPGDKQFGTVSFENSCSERLKKDFAQGVAMLHSFEYDEAEKVFAKIIDQEPQTAIAYWGVAMSNFHPLWVPPTPAELEKGSRAIRIAQSLTLKSERESDYIEALALFYKDSDKADHKTRCSRFEKAMEKIHADYADDIEAGIFYALALNAAADPSDQSLTKQKKAATLLMDLYAANPEHPGIAHYVIHSYDYPPVAAKALSAARKYASLAPASAHAQHMPSHVFTRLGLWDESIQSNLASTASAKCYAENMGIKGHWEEELHALDYLVYAYLQKGDKISARQQYDYLKSISQVWPVNFKVMYAFAAIPSRYVLENRMWQEASRLPLYPADFPWQDFPWQRAIIHFTRALGHVNMRHTDSARLELQEIRTIYDTLILQKDAYRANQVLIQVEASEAWILLREGRKEEALQLMKHAAELEGRVQKHPVTPGEVLPAMELLGDMLMELNQPEKALQAYRENLSEHPNRFNGLIGAASAAVKAGSMEKAIAYNKQLIAVTANSKVDRPELAAARQFLKNK